MVSISTSAQAQSQLNNLLQLLQQVSTLQTQTATGQKAQTFAGLGSDTLPDQQSRASLDALTNFDTNITNGQTTLGVMSSAVTKIQQQAQTVYQAMEGQIQNGNFDMTALHSIASNALSFIENLVNQQNGSSYVFAGADTTNQPLNNTGALDTYAQTNISQWVNGALTTDQLISSYRDPAQMTDNIIGYSATLSSGNARNVAIKADGDAEVDYTTLANDPTFRNIIAGITMVVNITGQLSQVSTTGSDPAGTVTAPGAGADQQQQNFYKVFNNLISMISGASTGLDQISSKLGYAQASLKTIHDNHTLDKNTLQSQIADAENVDMNEVAIKLSTLQTQLQASYQVTASLAQYSLAYILPVR
jgi:flagellar hook-associated protein 3 FlgL